MAILDLQEMKVPETKARFGSNRSHNRCGGGASNLSLLLC
jgi:Lanthionine-containing peptide SapB precursor RamS